VFFIGLNKVKLHYIIWCYWCSNDATNGWSVAPRTIVTIR